MNSPPPPHTSSSTVGDEGTGGVPKRNFGPHLTGQNNLEKYVKIIVNYFVKVNKCQDIFNNKTARGNKTPS